MSRYAWPVQAYRVEHKKTGQKARFFCQRLSRSLDSDDVLSLRTFLALSNCELNLLAFFQGLETAAGDSAEVSEYVRTVFLSDETKTFSFVEPFNSASSSRHNNNLDLSKYELDGEIANRSR